ncbi:hypothetical protein EVAR_86688_1 [Eumeta japonica]|uniref:CHK kinase-like domain-containing protein n=1 Tax=Eumeta variegata TaxID=151549 RepID=A0A4C1XZ76_EUMVA|nr:hypothetical protein EVAR_86688_1 [Eumeta japonica]
MSDREKIVNETLAIVIEREGIKDAEVIIRPLVTDTVNYTSTLYVITVKSLGSEDLELFAKVACVGEEIRRDMAFGEIYGRERLVYGEISKIYDRIQSQSDIAENEKFVFSKFYASGDGYLQETLILENLAARGYTTYNRFVSVTWEYASAAIRELAKLHALSYAFAERDPEGFDRTMKNAMHPFDGCEGNMFQLYKNTEAIALEAAPHESREKLRDFFVRESSVEKFYKNFMPSRRPVLAHGDYRPVT